MFGANKKDGAGRVPAPHDKNGAEPESEIQFDFEEDDKLPFDDDDTFSAAEDEDFSPPPPRGRARSQRTIILIALFLLLALAGGGYYLLNSPPAPPAPAPAPVKTKIKVQAVVPAAAVKAAPAAVVPAVPVKAAPAAVPPVAPVKAAPIAVAPVAPVGSAKAVPAPQGLPRTAVKTVAPAVASPPASAHAAFTLSTGAFLNQKHQKEIEKKIRRLGYSPKVQTTSSLVPMFRLRLGLYSPAAAQARSRELKAQVPDLFALKQGEKVALYAGSYQSLDLSRSYADQLYLRGIHVDEETVTLRMPLKKISYGSFASRSLAEKAAKRAVAAGLPAEVVKR